MIWNGLNSRRSINETIKILEIIKLVIKKLIINFVIGVYLDKDIGDVLIPIAYDENNNIVKIPEKDLPVKFPDNINLNINTNGNPLDSNEDWKNYY